MAENNDELIKQKKIQFYAAIVNAWIATRFQKDKSLLTLSAGAIGLLVTLLTTVGTISLYNVVFYLLAILSFLVCLICAIHIFQRNTVVLLKEINGDKRPDKTIKCLDKAIYWSFISGIIFSCIIGISSGITIYNKQESVMSDKKERKTRIIQPEKTEQHSLDGIGELNPNKRPPKEGSNGGTSGSGEGKTGKDK